MGRNVHNVTQSERLPIDVFVFDYDMPMELASLLVRPGSTERNMAAMVDYIRHVVDEHKKHGFQLTGGIISHETT